MTRHWLDEGSGDPYGDGWLPPDVRQHEDADPDELGTFGEVLSYWTASGGMSRDVRRAYWKRWGFEVIAWAVVLAGATVVMTQFDGVTDLLARAFGVLAIVALAWQAAEAVRVGRESRHWHR